MPVKKSDFSLIGPGRLGMKLARALINAGWRCTKIRGRRSPEHYDRSGFPNTIPWDSWEQPKSWQPAPLIFICVEDCHIEEVAESLVRELPPDPATIFHTSGLLTSEALAPCRARSAEVASWHPLQSFPAQGDVEFLGIPCAVEGDESAVKTGFKAAFDLGLKPWIIERDHKTLYHAAAVVAANLSHILISAACETLKSCGPLPSQPGTMLAPLIRTSIESALEGEGLDGLTGPIARGDEKTIERHLEVLPKELRSAYAALVEYVRIGKES